MSDTKHVVMRIVQAAERICAEEGLIFPEMVIMARASGEPTVYVMSPLKGEEFTDFIAAITATAKQPPGGDHAPS